MTDTYQRRPPSPVHRRPPRLLRTNGRGLWRGRRYRPGARLHAVANDGWIRKLTSSNVDDRITDGFYSKFFLIFFFQYVRYSTITNVKAMILFGET